jgi:hypothetical protein
MRQSFVAGRPFLGARASLLVPVGVSMQTIRPVDMASPVNMYVVAGAGAPVRARMLALPVPGALPAGDTSLAVSDGSAA